MPFLLAEGKLTNPPNVLFLEEAYPLIRKTINDKLDQYGVRRVTTLSSNEIYFRTFFESQQKFDDWNIFKETFPEYQFFKQYLIDNNIIVTDYQVRWVDNIF